MTRPKGGKEPTQPHCFLSTTNLNVMTNITSDWTVNVYERIQIGREI
jgi:hypothetical protein